MERPHRLVYDDNGYPKTKDVLAKPKIRPTRQGIRKTPLKTAISEEFWSEWGDSNVRSLDPKAVYIIPYDDLCRFPAISSRLRILFKTLISTVSAYSTPVCSQICGQKTAF